MRYFFIFQPETKPRIKINKAIANDVKPPLAKAFKKASNISTIKILFANYIQKERKK